MIRAGRCATHRLRVALAALVCAAAGPSFGETGHAAPLAVTNVGPLAGLYGLPRVRGAAVSEHDGEWMLRTEIANNFTASTRPQIAVAFDGETRVVAVGFRRGIGSRWDAGLEIPYVEHSGGVTDALVEGFHDLFGMPQADRDEVSRNRLDYRLIYQGRSLIDVDATTRSLGDSRLWGGWQAYRSSDRSLALRGQLKLPTGQTDRLSGSEGTDASLWVEYADAQLLERMGLQLSLMGGVTLLGSGELLPAAQETVAFSGHVGLQYPMTRRLALLAQLDGHSRLIDSGLDKAGGEGLIGTFGMRLQWSAATQVELALAEDLRTTTAPDVTFQLVLAVRV
jgi:hypothetical protein